MMGKLEQLMNLRRWSMRGYVILAMLLCVPFCMKAQDSPYGISVAGTAVTDENMNDILDGANNNPDEVGIVSFSVQDENTYKLKLDKANIKGSIVTSTNKTVIIEIQNECSIESLDGSCITTTLTSGNPQLIIQVSIWGNLLLIPQQGYPAVSSLFQRETKNQLQAIYTDDYTVAFDDDDNGFENSRSVIYYQATLTIGGKAVFDRDEYFSMGIKIEANYENVLGDKNCSISYKPGTNTVILNNAMIDMSTRGDNAVICSMSKPPLAVKLKGKNTIKVNNQFPKAFRFDGYYSDLYFGVIKDETGWGSLKVIGISDIDDLADSFDLENDFQECDPDNPDKASNGWKYIANTQDNTLTLWFLQVPSQVKLAPLSNEPNTISTIDYLDPTTQEIKTEPLFNKEYDNIFYTLEDDGTESTPDGWDQEEGLILTSQMYDNEMSSILDMEIDSEDYINKYIGLTFVVPAGYGMLIVNSVINNGTLLMRIGRNEPYVIENNPDHFKEACLVDTVYYAVEEPTYVYLYHSTDRPASREMNLNRIAPKYSWESAIRSLTIVTGMIDEDKPVPTNPKQLKKTDLAAAISGLPSEGYEGGRLIINDANVTTLADDVFDGIENKIVTYVDLSGTSIKGITVDRTKAPFNKIPVSAFIYLPTDNEVGYGSKNVVIGSVCQDMILYDSEIPFEAARDFRAAHFEYDRDFSAFSGGMPSTIYLPIELEHKHAKNLGKVYKCTEIDNEDAIVYMKETYEAKANTPYMFRSAVNKIIVDHVDVITPASQIANDDVEEVPDQFKGTYQYMYVFSDDDNTYFCIAGAGQYKGQWVRVSTSASAPVTINPFRAYFKFDTNSLDLSRQTMDIDWGDGTTSVIPIDNILWTKDKVRNDAYYDLTGRKIAKPTKGIYIYNGKKYVR